MGKPEKNVVCEIKCTRENNCYDSKCLQSKKRKIHCYDIHQSIGKLRERWTGGNEMTL